MIVEERCYVLRSEVPPAEYLQVYESTGALDLQRRTLGLLLGYFVCEVGQLNSLVHLWGYDSFEERARRRALLASEPRWQEYLVRIRPMIASMSNRLLVPTAFSPLPVTVPPGALSTQTPAPGGDQGKTDSEPRERE
jgi:hypothetical protein